MTFLIDSHCHLNMQEFHNDLDEVVSSAKKNGVLYLNSVCTDIDDMPRLMEITRKYTNVFTSVGVHPHYAVARQNIRTDDLIKLSDSPKVIGFGEAGLDNYFPNRNPKIQKDVFVKHIHAAQETQLPLIVHTRNAEVDTLEILKNEMQNKPFLGLIHCYTSGVAFAKAIIDLGFSISLSGICTLKSRGEEVTKAIKYLPLDCLLVETDSPFLTPKPVNNKRNEPAFVRFIAERIAKIKNVQYNEVATITSNNFIKLFAKCQIPLIK